VGSDAKKIIPHYLITLTCNMSDKYLSIHITISSNTKSVPARVTLVQKVLSEGFFIGPTDRYLMTFDLDKITHHLGDAVYLYDV